MSAKCQRCGERERRYPLVVTLVAHEMSGPWNAWGACLCEPCRAIVLTAIESAMQPASEKNTAEPGSIRKDEQASRSSEGFDDGEAAAVHLSTDSAVPASPACEHALHDLLLDANEGDLREAIGDTSFEDLAKRGRDAADRALEAASPPAPREWTQAHYEAASGVVSAVRSFIGSRRYSASDDVCAALEKAAPSFVPPIRLPAQSDWIFENEAAIQAVGERDAQMRIALRAAGMEVVEEER